MLHLLRCSPSASHASLTKFDALLRQAIQRITNCDLTDIQWIQASLPVRDGGLAWDKSVSSLSLPAFLASAACRHTLPLQDDILNECLKSDSDFLQSYLSEWSTKFGEVPDTLPTKQPFWDRPAWSAREEGPGGSQPGIYISSDVLFGRFLTTQR